MLVKAIRTGFYGNKRIKEDQFFNLKKEEDFSEVWMEKQEEEEPKKKKQVKKEVVQFDNEDDVI